MASTDILKIVPTMQSAALAGYAYKSIPKISKKRKIKKIKTKDIIKTGTGIIVGTALIKETADFIKS